MIVKKKKRYCKYVKKILVLFSHLKLDYYKIEIRKKELLNNLNCLNLNLKISPYLFIIKYSVPIYSIFKFPISRQFSRWKTWHFPSSWLVQMYSSKDPRKQVSSHLMLIYNVSEIKLIIFLPPPFPPTPLVLFTFYRW